MIPVINMWEFGDISPKSRHLGHLYLQEWKVAPGTMRDCGLGWMLTQNKRREALKYRKYIHENIVALYDS